MNKRQRKKQTKQLVSVREGLSSTSKKAEFSSRILDILARATKEVVLTVLVRVMRNANQRQNRRLKRPMVTLKDDFEPISQFDLDLFSYHAQLRRGPSPTIE